MSEFPKLPKPDRRRTSAKQRNRLPSYSNRGRIQTDWQEIQWTKRKVVIATIILGVPYAIAVLAALGAKNYIVTAILLGLGVLVGAIALILKWLERADL